MKKAKAVYDKDQDAATHRYAKLYKDLTACFLERMEEQANKGVIESITLKERLVTEIFRPPYPAIDFFERNKLYADLKIFAETNGFHWEEYKANGFPCDCDSEKGCCEWVKIT